MEQKCENCRFWPHIAYVPCDNPSSLFFETSTLYTDHCPEMQAKEVE